MKLSNKIAWTEGLLLLPQHFQQVDRYHESLVFSRLSALDPQNFGVVSLDFDRHRLAQQQELVLTHFEGVMPDGMPVSLGGGQGVLPEARSVEEHFGSVRQALDVYLAVPAERPGVNNYATNGERLRFRTKSHKIYDVSADGRHENVELISPNPLLLLGEEPRDDSWALKIAEVVRDPRGALTLSPTYIPPCLQVAAAPALRAGLKRILTAAVVRYRALSSARRVVGENRVELDPGDVSRLLRLQAIGAALPVLHYLVTVADVPPKTAYLQLAQLGGKLAPFTTEVDMTEPLPYDFLDLRGTFEHLFGLVERLLKVAEEQGYLSVTLQLHEGNRFFGDLTDEQLLRAERFFLSVETSLPRARLVHEFVQNAKVAALGDLEVVLASNVGGTDLRETVQPPPQLPLKPGLVYFELPLHSDDIYWKHVLHDRNVVVWVPPGIDCAQTTLKLVALPGRHG